MIFFENLITGAKKEADSYVCFYAFIPWNFFLVIINKHYLIDDHIACINVYL